MNNLMSELYKNIKYNKGVEKINKKKFLRNFSFRITNPKKCWGYTEPIDIVKDVMYLYANVCENHQKYRKYFDDEIIMINEIFENGMNTFLENLNNNVSQFTVDMSKGRTIRYFNFEINEKSVNGFYYSINENMNTLRRNIFTYSKLLEFVSKYLELQLGFINVNTSNIDLSDIDDNIYVKQEISTSNAFKFSSINTKDITLLSAIERGLYNCSDMNELNEKYEKWSNSKNIFSSKNLNYLISMVYYINVERLGGFDEKSNELMTNTIFPELETFFTKR